MSRGKLTIEQRLKQANSRLQNENVLLRNKLKERDERIDVLEKKLEKALLYIEELQKYVFRGKKKDKDNNDDDNDDKNNKSGSSGSDKRSNSSYRRPTPHEDEITDFKEYHISNCPDCNTVLSKIRILEFFEEDIIPIMEWFEKLKKVTKVSITTGYCSNCKKRFSAIPIPKQKVSIGENIKQLITFQCTVQQLSYSQIADFLESHLHFNISNGEIANILSRQASKLKPTHDDLIKSIRESKAIHMDETGYNIAFHDEYSGNHAWVMTSAENTDAVFVLGKNRGGGNIPDLIGNDFNGIGISDNYGAYTNAFQKGKHALCWAHPLRKFRDLKNSKGLNKEKKQVCNEFYRNFAEVYSEVTKVHQTDFDRNNRKQNKNVLMNKLKNILTIDKNDPIKLKTLKTTMLKKIDRYFVCITNKNIPMDNNKAERSLRHLVIKRKKSFGSKTPKGAEVMSILYSVIMSLWWKDKQNFFKSYAEVLG